MSAAFDLWSYDDVVQNSGAILGRLRDGTMPCDGAWPEEQVDLFQHWVDAGCRPESERVYAAERLQYGCGPRSHLVRGVCPTRRALPEARGRPPDRAFRRARSNRRGRRRERLRPASPDGRRSPRRHGERHPGGPCRSWSRRSRLQAARIRRRGRSAGAARRTHCKNGRPERARLRRKHRPIPSRRVYGGHIRSGGDARVA